MAVKATEKGKLEETIPVRLGLTAANKTKLGVLLFLMDGSKSDCNGCVLKSAALFRGIVRFKKLAAANYHHKERCSKRPDDDALKNF